MKCQNVHTDKKKQKNLRKVLASKGAQEQLNIKLLRRNLEHQLHFINS